jgi:hypothetical protein
LSDKLVMTAATCGAGSKPKNVRLIHPYRAAGPDACRQHCVLLRAASDVAV